MCEQASLSARGLRWGFVFDVREKRMPSEIQLASATICQTSGKIAYVNSLGAACSELI